MELPLGSQACLWLKEAFWQLCSTTLVKIEQEQDFYLNGPNIYRYPKVCIN